MKQKITYLVFACLFGLMANAQQTSKKTTTIQKQEMVYRNVEVIASYRGGYDALLKKIETATKHCKSGKIRNQKAEVVAEVLIDKTGKATDVQFIKADTDLCQNDIIKALKTANQWIPARINNKPVASYLQIRINLHNNMKDDRSTVRATMN